MYNMKKISLILLTLLFLGTLDYLTKERNDYPGAELINREGLMNHVDYLTSPELNGRLSGSEGYNKAAEYAADQIIKFGLKTVNDDYYQYLNVEYNEIKEPLEFGLIEDGTIIKEYQIGKDFVCRGFTGSGNFNAEAVFCGYGISAPELGYDDYADIDVKDKVVIAFKYNPKWKLESGNWPTGYPRQKAHFAASHGAKGILFVSLPNDAAPQKTIGSILCGDGDQLVDFPQLHISIETADELLSSRNLTLSQLQTIIDSTKHPQSVSTVSKVNLNINASYDKEGVTMNVVGLLEGSDENLKDEYVVIGAHLDHVGRQGEIYFPGANDNASGSAAVLELAKAFSKNKSEIKRSIIFVLFASEELGLYGAKHFVANSPVPKENIVAMMNLDCIGHGDSIRLGNGKSAPKLWDLAIDIDHSTNNMTVDNTWSGGGADASPFHNAGIPALYFVTTNSYTHLHYMTDTAETLNQDLFEKITRLAYMTSYEVAKGNYQREIVIK